MSLSIKNLSKSFGEKKIFDNFSYTFEGTGVYAVVGNSGVGKTTFLRMIAGLDTAYIGSIEGGGFKNVAFAFQEYRLFPTLNALKNVTVPNERKNSDDISEKARAILLGLGFKESELYQSIDELSGGMKQRVSLARAFVSSSPILLLDEPTKELDAGIREKLYQLILDEAKERLVIIVSHHKEDIERLSAKRICM